MKSKRSVSRIIDLLSSLVLAVLVTAATLGSPTPSLAEDENDPTYGNITRVTAALMENSQFLHLRFDNKLATRFLDLYLDSLDPSHQLFIKSDREVFDLFSSRLPDMISIESDLTPECTIFQRYLERLDQRAVYVRKLLRNEKFDFTGNDTFLLEPQ